MSTTKMKHGAIFLLALTAAVRLGADEGMWPYNRLPADRLKEAHQFEPAPELIEKLQKSSVRLNNGGSGSFVSPRGLVMTNHHVASDCIRKLSSETKDYIADGFYATAQARELKCPDLELNVLMEIEEVTSEVNRGVTAEMSDAERLEAQRAAQARIEKDCKDSTLMRCDVVDLYRGGIFDLYKYKRYDDIRLVFAPEYQAAFFGGDPDNFNYPRFCLDAAFLRVYENDRPIETPFYLPFSKEGVAEQEFTMVSGHPGSTQRLLTESQVVWERDHRVPFMLDWLREMAAELTNYGRTGGDAERLARDELFRLDNAIKAYSGQLAGLRDSALFNAKSEQEKSLRAKVEADAELHKQYGDAWKTIAGVQRLKLSVYEDYRLVETFGFFSRYYTIARHLYRLGDELEKPNEERLPEYRDSGLESLYQQIYSPAPIYPDLEIVNLTQSLTFMRDRLGPRHELVEAVLGRDQPGAAARRLIQGTQLADVEFRKQLGADQSKLAKDSDDPMIALVRSIDSMARDLRKRYEDEIEAVETAQGAKIARARFAVLGGSVYPDATFTLRLSFGIVRAYLENRRRVDAFTTIGGMYEHATGEFPYVLPKKLLDAKRRMKADTPLNLVSTNDITGGNSGSPLVNAQGEAVGLIFDGNIQSLSNDFLYDERQARAVSVDVRGILELLRNAYRTGRLVNELTAAQQ